MCFIEEDFSFYSKWYEKIYKASRKLTGGLENVFYNAQIGFTQQYPVDCVARKVINGDRIVYYTDNVPSEKECDGKKGTISCDNEYLYVCVDDNCWKKVKLEDFQ